MNRNFREYHEPDEREAIINRTRDASPGITPDDEDRMRRLMSNGGEDELMGEDGLDDAGPDGMDLDGPPEGLGDEMDGMDDELGDEEGLGEEDSVDCGRDELRQLLDDVEMGDLSAEEAFEKLCSGGEEEELGGMEDDLGGEELGGMDDLGSMGNMGVSGGLDMESVSRIASLITDDPDILKQS